jgi:DNA-binding response OmpR family regulator
MPDMDGLQLGKWYSENRPDERHCFIMMTGAIDNEAEEYCAKHGCDIVHKPFDEKELFAAICNALDKCKSAEVNI